MPEPNRPHWRVQDELKDWTIANLVAAQARILVCCEACHHWHVFQTHELSRLARGSYTATLASVAPRLRCAGVARGRRCRSEWVRIGLDDGYSLPPWPTGATAADPR